MIGITPKEKMLVSVLVKIYSKEQLEEELNDILETIDSSKLVRGAAKLIGINANEISRIGLQYLNYAVDNYEKIKNKEYPEDIHLVENLDELVEISDVIIVSSPLNKTTERLFNKQLLSRMKNKFLINVGRGKIVEEESLYNALKNNDLKGYASDVWYNYPHGKEVMLPSTYPIYEFDNVVMSNHSGGFTENTNNEVNKDILITLKKLRNENFEDKLNLKNLL